MCRSQRAEKKVIEKTQQYECAKKKLEKKLHELNLAKHQLARAETVHARDEEKVDTMRVKLAKRLIREAYISKRKFLKCFLFSNNKRNVYTARRRRLTAWAGAGRARKGGATRLDAAIVR